MLSITLKIVFSISNKKGFLTWIQKSQPDKWLWIIGCRGFVQLGWGLGGYLQENSQFLFKSMYANPWIWFTPLVVTVVLLWKTMFFLVKNNKKLQSLCYDFFFCWIYFNVILCHMTFCSCDSEWRTILENAIKITTQRGNQIQKSHYVLSFL